MNSFDNKSPTIKQDEVIAFLSDTSQLISKQYVNQLSSAATAAQNSNVLVNQVEFWKWMDRNFSTGGMFDSTAAMQEYISRGAGKEAWFAKQLQGKGYEWDWMVKQRADPRNLFSRYDAGDVANRAASDVTETNLITGKTREYQMKAYTSKTNPALKNTPKDMTVVTNAEKVEIVKKNGYKDVQEFQDSEAIKEATDKRMEQVKSNKAQTSYNFSNIAGVMMKAGAIGCVIGMGTEAIASFRAWKEQKLTDKEYLREILKAGGDAGITAGATAGIMVPVTAAISAAGLSSVVAIPIAFVVSSAVNKVIAPCFARGEYQKILNKARYYQNLNMAYEDLLVSMELASKEYYTFVCQMAQQQQTFQAVQHQNQELNRNLVDLLDSI